MEYLCLTPQLTMYDKRFKNKTCLSLAFEEDEYCGFQLLDNRRYGKKTLESTGTLL